MKDSAKNTIETTDYALLDKTEMCRLLLEKEKHISELAAKVSWFEEQFKLYQHQKFSKSSEKGDSLQLSFFDEDDQAVQSESDKDQHETLTYTRKKPDRQDKHLDTSNLPREKRYIDLTEAEKQCACGHKMVQFGEDSKEELVLIPSVIKVIKHIRAKYCCRHCETVRIPPNETGYL